ncbi:MAG: hypothetical protein ABGX43_07765, partial [Nitrospinaceae bacterium]
SHKRPQNAQHVRPSGSSWSETQATAGAVLGTSFTQGDPSRASRGAAFVLIGGGYNHSDQMQTAQSRFFTTG